MNYKRKTPEEIREIRTTRLKKDWNVYCVVGIKNGAPKRTFEEWAEWVWKSHQKDVRSVFHNMSFEEYVNVG